MLRNPGNLLYTFTDIVPDEKLTNLLVSCNSDITYGQVDSLNNSHKRS